MRNLLTLLMFTTCLASSGLAAEPVTLETETDRINYSIGYQIGGDLLRQGVELNKDALAQGVEDAIREQAPLMTAEEMQTTLIELKRKIMADQQEKTRRIKEQYRGEGRDFLAANAEKEDVVVLPSGLQYKVIRPGSGSSPGPQDEVTVAYRGTLIDGREFDSSARHEGPATFRVDGVIPGWTEALQLMQEGAKWQLFLPADLGYGERGPLAEQVLIFEIELLDVNKPG